MLKSILEWDLYTDYTSNGINLVDLVTQLRYISLIIFYFLRLPWITHYTPLSIYTSVWTLIRRNIRRTFSRGLPISPISSTKNIYTVWCHDVIVGAIKKLFMVRWYAFHTQNVWLLLGDGASMLCCFRVDIFWQTSEI